MVATAHLIAGRTEEAAAGLPALGDLAIGTNVATSWAQLHLALVEVDAERNTPEVADVLWRHLEAMSERNAHRRAAELAVVCGELARLRGVPWRVTRAVGIAARHQQRLRAPLDDALLDVLEGLRSWCSEPQPMPAPVAAADLVAFLQVESSAVLPAERALTWIQQAREELPEDQELVLLEAQAALRCGLPHVEAMDVVWHHLEQHPEHDQVGSFLAWDVAERASDADLTRLQDLVGAVHPTVVWLAEAHLAFRREQHEVVVERCAQIVAADATAQNTRRLWAAALRELGRPAEAADRLRELLQVID
ncbi:hypothetical protein B7486_59870, partial [cyanobacterium TDX16]